MSSRARVKIERKTAKSKQVSQVHTTHDQEEANKLLANGWTLLHGGIGHVDNFGYNVKPMFVLGRVG